MDIEIITAKPEQLPEILELETKCFPVGDPIRMPAELGELAEDLGAGELLIASPSQANKSTKILGWLNFRGHQRLHLPAELPQISYISAIGVTSESRRLSVAQQLLRNLLAQHPDVAHFTSVHPENTASMKLFLACGFNISAYVPDLFGPKIGRNLLINTPTVGQWQGHSLVLVDEDRVDVNSEGYVRNYSPALPHGNLRLATVKLNGE